MTFLKGGVDGLSYFSLIFQLFYFLTRIIPESAKMFLKQNNVHTTHKNS